MHVDGDFRPEFVRQRMEYRLLIRMFLAGPQVVKPLNDPLLKVSRNLMEPHVRFDPIHTVLKVNFGRVDIGNNASHISHDSSKE